ncbi:hypothetical protein J6590_068091 [Homalodisca vitripennis]|nr:hypothetical protein J6590_068091 [Homalodisca vitripennis]
MPLPVYATKRGLRRKEERKRNRHWPTLPELNCPESGRSSVGSDQSLHKYWNPSTRRTIMWSRCCSALWNKSLHESSEYSVGYRWRLSSESESGFETGFVSTAPKSRTPAFPPKALTMTFFTLPKLLIEIETQIKNSSNLVWRRRAGIAGESALVTADR